MQRISSKATFFNKWLFPILWFGFLAFFVGQLVFSGAVKQDPVFLLAPLVMAVFGFFMMKFLVWDLADTVDDLGSHLLVRRNGVEATIPLSNIMNVSATQFVNPSRVTMRLVNPCELGASVSFSPKSPLSLNPFAKNPVAEELMERAFAARAKSAP
jgi:hypothetical protein